MELLEHGVRTADAAYAELADDGSTRLLSTAIIPPEARYTDRSATPPQTTVCHGVGRPP